MADKLTDADLVLTLKAAEGKTNAKAAAELGISVRVLQTRFAQAKTRGLTANSRLQSEEEKLRLKVKTLEAALRAKEREEDTAERIRQRIYELAARLPEPPAWTARDHGRNGKRGIPTTIWSDWHRGEIVRAEEVGGLNEFSSPIHDARVKRLVDTTIDLCFNHMGRAKTTYPGAVVMLGGDFINGDIHEELVIEADRTTQQNINELTDVLAAAIETMATKFGNVFCPAVVGNHGRSTRKPRMKGRVYCVTVDTPILTRDLRWVPAGDLKVGDGLLAFQEEAPLGRGQGRNFETARVTHASRAMAHVNRVILETGETISATDEHKFLVRGPSNMAYHWVSTEDMRGNPQRTYYLPRMVPQWKHDTSWASGYLAGAFDADGCLQINSDTGVSVQLSQRGNALLEKAKEALAELGFAFRSAILIDQWGKEQHTLTVLGGLQQTLKFLGTVRPPRLLANWAAYDVKQRRLWTRELVRVVSVEDGGERAVATLSSSSKTYISGGWPSHNTSHEWNIYCNLERHFRRSKHVSFFVPSGSDAYFPVVGTRYFLTHGDSLGVKGGDGIIGAIGPIMRGSIKVGNSEAQVGRDIDCIVMGHWHQPLWLPSAIVNGALKGYDEYARLQLRAPYSRPSQLLWFTHPEHGITAKWEVFLDGRKQAREILSQPGVPDWVLKGH